MDTTVLIVDDIMPNIEVLTDILGDSYKIMAATSGENAIKLLQRKKPHIALLDVSMPGIDGFGVLRFMKETPSLSDIPVIFVTGEYDVSAEEKGLAMGAVDYIKKPYSASIVKVKVRNHIELKHHRDNLELMVQGRTIELEERTKQLAASREAIIMGMSLMSEVHDMVTGDHIERIKIFTEILALKLLELYPSMISRKMAELTVLFSPLHDVGKIGIPDTILKKKASLTDEEFDIMKRHTLGGAELLRKTSLFLVDSESASDLSVATDIAECHHEKFDGSGYPRNLKGEEIPLPARIVSVADVYDALRSVRQYKKAYTHEEAVDIILHGDDRTRPEHFDPKVLDAFALVHRQFEKALDEHKPTTNVYQKP